MARQKFSTPISILIVSLFVILLSLASAFTSAHAVPLKQDEFDLTDTAEQQTSDVEDTQDAATDTADAKTEAAASGTSSVPNQSATATPTTTATAGTATAGTVTATSTLGPGTPAPTITQLAQSVQPAATAFSVPQQQLSPTVELSPELPTETVEEVPSDALTCSPGAPITITGTGPAHAAFLLYFGQRVVSGGSISGTGTFSARLVVGGERAGIYPVTVRVRGTSQLLREMTCSVPDVTPTPLPRARSIP